MPLHPQPEIAPTIVVPDLAPALISWKRCALTAFLNALIPGCGLIVARREWLGITLALLYGLCVQVLLAGTLIAPAAIPTWLTACAAGLAALTWAGAQVMLWKQLRVIRDPHLHREIDRLLTSVNEAAARGDLDAARSLLQCAQTLNDEHPAVWKAWAELFTQSGNLRAAQRAQRRLAVLQSRS
jgi:hypothetical protein